MLTTFAMFAAAALTTQTADVHRVSLDHRGTALDVRYGATVTTSLKQVGMSAGTRQSSERCLWKSSVAVERHVGRADGGQTLSRTLPDTTTMSGSRPGSCAANRDGIAADVARRDDDVRAHVLAAARADRSALHAEIDAARSLAMN